MDGASAAGGPADSVDRDQWERVLGEVGPRALRRYAASYLELLPERLAGLGRAVATGDRPETVRIAADLRTSSTMLGARRLATLVALVESAPEAVCADRRRALRVLRDEAHAVERALWSALTGLSGRQTGPVGDGGGQPRRVGPPNR